MSASLEDIEDSLFEDTSFDEKVTRFASDSGCQVVYITKETFIDVDDDGKLKVVVAS
jgi:dynein heavy chain 1